MPQGAPGLVVGQRQKRNSQDGKNRFPVVQELDRERMRLGMGMPPHRLATGAKRPQASLPSGAQGRAGRAFAGLVGGLPEVVPQRQARPAEALRGGVQAVRQALRLALQVRPATHAPFHPPARLPAVARQHAGKALQDVSCQLLAAVADAVQDGTAGDEHPQPQRRRALFRPGGLVGVQQFALPDGLDQLIPPRRHDGRRFRQDFVDRARADPDIQPWRNSWMRARDSR